MSRNEWERGELKMSTKEFGSVRRDMVAFYNDRQNRLFSKAEHIYVNLKELGKGKRGFNYHDCFAGLTAQFNSDTASDIFDAIFPNEQVEKLVAGQIIKGYERREKPLAPKKKSFAPIKQSTDRIYFGEAGIIFDKKRRVIVWATGENNHAVERAREHEIAREFFKRLSRVVWTRGTGGEIVGNDEYNQDARGAGEGSNYVTARYGVAEKQFKKYLGVR